MRASTSFSLSIENKSPDLIPIICWIAFKAMEESPLITISFHCILRPLVKETCNEIKPLEYPKESKSYAAKGYPLF